ncbi:MAG: trypsin-like peptidase domain-containing protein, partial [Lachnospiraceae bacterium]|nr:trypsin-like peptidase domain-containing protein [Lachnospiraceae bacterium]
MSNFLKKFMLAMCLGLSFGLFMVAGGVVVARYTGLWELWEEASREGVEASAQPPGLYDTSGADIPETGQLKRTLPEEAGYQEQAADSQGGVLQSTEDDPYASGEEGNGAAVSDSEDNIAKAAAPAYNPIVYDVSGVAERVMPAVVAITNHYVETASFWGRTYRQEAEASGSGIIVGESDDEILLVTNYHVVQDATRLTVVFFDEETAEATIKGTARSMDLAVVAVSIKSLKSSTLNSIAVAVLGDSDSLQVGEPAIAIGNALGYGQSVTLGVVSAVNRALSGYEDEEIGGQVGFFIQTDAAINPGNSGGALLNIKGEVIGINSNKIGGEAVEGMGYAIPISVAKPIISELIGSKERNRVADVDKGFLGITGATVTQEAMDYYGMPKGVYITGIITNSGADFAGLREGDVIESFGTQRIASLDDLQDALSYYPTGS